MINLKASGSYKNLEKFLRKIEKDIFSELESFGRMGVSALKRATPTDSGLTADSWKYEIIKSGASHQLVFRNTNTHNGENVAILIQYGHGTGTGGYVAGRDYINPAIQPLFDKMADDIWKKVTRA